MAILPPPLVCERFRICGTPDGTELISAQRQALVGFAVLFNKLQLSSPPSRCGRSAGRAERAVSSDVFAGRRLQTQPGKGWRLPHPYPAPHPAAVPGVRSLSGTVRAGSHPSTRGLRRDIHCKAPSAVLRGG
ncbi:unnamed protein product [Coccothraustes coccothraustes]